MEERVDPVRENRDREFDTRKVPRNRKRLRYCPWVREKLKGRRYIPLFSKGLLGTQD